MTERPTAHASARRDARRIAADTDGDKVDEIFGDFGSLGLWMWDSGAWTQISSKNPD